jgi:hypothetical protein
MFNAQEFLKLSSTGKIDSRMKTATETHPIYLVERAYCVICGKKGGYSSQESSKYIRPSHLIYVCDDCVFAYGEPVGLEKADVKEIL